MSNSDINAKRVSIQLKIKSDTESLLLSNALRTKSRDIISINLTDDLESIIEMLNKGAVLLALPISGYELVFSRNIPVYDSTVVSHNTGVDSADSISYESLSDFSESEGITLGYGSNVGGLLSTKRIGDVIVCYPTSRVRFLTAHMRTSDNFSEGKPPSWVKNWKTMGLATDDDFENYFVRSLAKVLKSFIVKSIPFSPRKVILNVHIFFVEEEHLFYLNS